MTFLSVFSKNIDAKIKKKPLTNHFSHLQTKSKFSSLYTRAKVPDVISFPTCGNKSPANDAFSYG